MKGKDLVEVVERASSPAERLGTGFRLDTPADDDAPVNARVERWRQLVAEGHQAAFERRLALDGLDQTSVRRAVGRARLAPDHPLPAWASTLSAALEAATSLELQPGGAVTDRCLDADRPTPFAPLVLPFVLAARERLAARAGAAIGHLTEAAGATLERSLLMRLVRLCAGPLDLEFTIFRATRQSSFTRFLGTLPDEPSRELYGEFIDRMRTGGLRAFFLEYPVLARLTATRTDFWVDAVAEFLRRLDTDGPDLQAAFSSGAGLGRISAIETALSDSHNQGRAVLGITFESGVRLVYKPKDLALEEIYFALLAWLNDGSPLRFKLLRIVCRPGYGWAEFAEQLPCAEDSSGLIR